MNFWQFLKNLFRKKTEDNQFFNVRAEHEQIARELEDPVMEHFPDFNDFVAEVERNLKARGKNPEDSFVWREMKERSEDPQEIQTTPEIVDGKITHVSISPEEYSRITSQLNYNQAAQFTTMELARRQLCIKQQGQE